MSTPENDIGIDLLAQAGFQVDAQPIELHAEAIPSVDGFIVESEEPLTASVDTEEAAGDADATARKVEVARSIKPGCLHWNVKAKDFPKDDKPGATILKEEVVRRDNQMRPTAWSLTKLCEWLHTHAPPGALDSLLQVLVQ